MNIPTIGGARGIFEIFIPGTFLLLNLGFVIYISPFTDDEIRTLINSGAASPAIALIFAICFGYLLGVLLRLFRTDLPDQLSARLLRVFARRGDPRETKAWATDEFPYIDWIGESCALYLSEDARNFFKKTWGDRKLAGQNKQFFNFAKVIINSEDTQAASELYAAEALTRYISGMFYALFFSLFLLLLTMVSLYSDSGQLSGGLILITATYFLAIMVILTRFRFIRIKEVEAVFAASFKNRKLFGYEEDEPLEQLAGKKTPPGIKVHKARKKS